MSRSKGLETAAHDRSMIDDAIMPMLCHFCGILKNDDVDKLYVLMKLCYSRGIIDESIKQEYWHKRMMESE